MTCYNANMAYVIPDRVKGLYDPRSAAELEQAQKTCERLRHFQADTDDAMTLHEAAIILGDMLFAEDNSRELW